MGLFTSFQIKSRDPETRRRAALSLGVPGKHGAIAQLQPLLQDPEFSVRAAAVEALGVIADASAAPLVVEALNASEGGTDKEAGAALRAAAVAALVRIGPPSVEGLVGVLHGRSPRLREAAIEALGQVGGDQAVAAMVPSLNDDRSNVRQAAAAAIGKAGGASAVASLGAALTHKDPATRKCLVQALGSVGTVDAIAALRGALSDRDRGVRDAAIGALAALPFGEAASALVDAYLSGDRELRVATATVLKTRDWEPRDSRGRILHAVLHGRFDEAASQGADALEPLVLALSDRDSATRAGAARALGRLADGRAAGPLCGLLSDADASVRDASVAALVQVGAAVAAPLSRLLDDRAATTRHAVNQVIEGIGGARLVEHLAGALAVGVEGEHAGTPLRIVRDRGTLDAAREIADALTLLVPRVLTTLPPATLNRLAGVGDVMLIEEGEVPTASDTVSCEAARAAAARALAK